MKSVASDSAVSGSDLLLGRHDNHNLEIKLHLQLPQSKFRSGLHVYMFFPHSLDPSLFTKQDLLSDFRSRSRLAVVDKSALQSDDLASQLKELESVLKAARPDEWIIQRLVQWIGAVTAEQLKIQSTNYTRQSLLLCSLFSKSLENPQNVEQRIFQSISHAAHLREQIRNLVAQHNNNPWVHILESYCHQAFLSFVSTVQDSISIYKDRATLQGQIEFRIRTELKKETEHCQKFPSEQANLGDSDKLTQLSQMKKYFQSALFVDVQKRSGYARFREPAALAGTALAGVAAAGIQILSESSGWHLSASSTAIFSLGIMFYVFRDRMKDWARDHLSKRASEFTPDVEQTMIVGGREVGRATERLRVMSSNATPADIQILRFKETQNLLEKNLAEDVLFYEYDQICSEPLHAHLQDSVRINIHRYLKLMDDPVKEVTVLDNDGTISRRASKKIYPVWAVIQQKIVSGPTESKLNHVYRILIDKTGIQKVELMCETTASI